MSARSDWCGHGRHEECRPLARLRCKCDCHQTDNDTPEKDKS